MSVTTTPDTKASVDGGPWRKGTFSAVVALDAGQSFNIVFVKGYVRRAYHFRCLPSDFPTFTATRTGPTQAQWYIMTPSLLLTPSTGLGSQQYAAVFDHNGVPVWWMRSGDGTLPLDAKLLPNGDVAWMHYNIGPGTPNTGFEEHRLDGTLVRRLDTVPGGADHHDLQLLPNGDYLLGRAFTRSPVDMSGCGGSTTGTLTDFELQELTPNGTLVWSWRASDHIPVSETESVWRFNCVRGASGDVYHWNSVEPDGDGYILSFRHLNAIYKIDRATGAIDWKLGGTPTPESLTAIGDPDSATSTFCGQHDARVLPDGTVTVFDDGTGCDRLARDVRYSIDEQNRTATLLEDITDPQGAFAQCCGSARKLPGGDWVTDWGGYPYMTEQTPDGTPVFTLSFAAPLFSYRADPVLPGVISRAQLRAGMNAQYPRPPQGWPLSETRRPPERAASAGPGRPGSDSTPSLGSTSWGPVGRGFEKSSRL